MDNFPQLSSPADLAGACLMAVGIPLGLSADPDDLQEAPAGLVRRGGEIVYLTVPAYGLWLSMLSSPVPDELFQGAPAAEFTDASDIVRQFEAAHLLLSYERSAPDSSVTLRTLRAIPVGIALGNSVEKPDTYSLADSLFDPVLELGPIAYAVWCSLDGMGSMLDACREVAEAHALPPALVIEHAWQLLPILMRMRLVVLDYVPDQLLPGPERGAEASGLPQVAPKSELEALKAEQKVWDQLRLRRAGEEP